MLKNKILFVFKRYKHNDNKILTSKNLSFLSTISFIIVIRSFKSIIKNELNENNFDMNFSKNILNKKKLISISKTLKEKMIKKIYFINIAKIDASTYYYLIRNKKNKLFSLTMNKTYNTLYESFLIKTMQKNNHILFNKSYLCDFEIKYKKSYKSYISKIT